MAKRKVYKLKEESKGLILEKRGKLGITVFDTTKTPAGELGYYHANGFAEHIDVEEVEDESTLPKKEKAPVVPIKNGDDDEEDEDDDSEDDDEEEELDLGLDEEEGEEGSEPELEPSEEPSESTIFEVEDGTAAEIPAAPEAEEKALVAPIENGDLDEKEELGKLKVSELQACLKALDIPYNSKETKASLISKLSK